MSQFKMNELFARADDLETRYCILLNSSSQRQFIKLFFRVVSRLGDGIFWYILAGFLTFLHADERGGVQALHILLTGLCGVLVYKFLKERLVRQRPFIKCDVIQQAAPALDRYSFPSGHTMHAVSFSIMFSYYLPEMSLRLSGDSQHLVALSRVVLGLHYPSDVLAGAILGATVSRLQVCISLVN